MVLQNWQRVLSPILRALEATTMAVTIQLDGMQRTSPISVEQKMLESFVMALQMAAVMETWAQKRVLASELMA
jgi:hypothetical protein